MIKKLLVAVVLIPHTVDAQDIRRFFSGFLSPNTDNSVYTAMQNIWYANEPISYVAPVPVFIPLEARRLPLREGEGKGGYIVEGSLLHRAPIAMGRNHGEHQWQTSRITFDYGFNIRMAADHSSPLIPNNNIFGLTVDKILWNSHTTGLGLFSKSTRHALTEDWRNAAERKALQNLSFNITFRHYSNGQPPGFFYDSLSSRRNDYLSGDFSTNYAQAGLTYSYLTPRSRLFSVKLAYQRDGTVCGPLSYSEEQRMSYGQDRILGFIQYRHLSRRKKYFPADIIVEGCEERVKEQNRINYFNEFVFRVEYEYIAGNLRKYKEQYQLNSDYRLSTHFYFYWTRPTWRILGIMAHFYYGRDYSNIRYDDPVLGMMAGLSVNFNKYHPAIPNAVLFAE